jgi:methenyltetrahydromethanopterin cyclohydrolase
MATISVNNYALRLVMWAIERKEELGISVEKHPSGATFIDAGIKSQGGFLAGRILTEICMGGLGQASLGHETYHDLILPTIVVQTDFPAIALLGAQFAGWQIKTGNYFAMGSGPARALALKPKELYEKIAYQDDSENAVLILETHAQPPTDALRYVANECRVRIENLYVLAAPTSSLTGSVQISGRIVEAGIHKLTELGFDPKRVLHATGYAPIAPVHPNSARAMGRTNDALYYGGVTFYTVDYEDDAKLGEIVAKAPSSRAKGYGTPFYEIFKSVGFDFYKIDPNLFAPAVVCVNNIRTGVTHMAGNINVKVLRETMGIGPAE